MFAFQIAYVKADISTDTGVKDILDKAISQFEKLDVLVSFKCDNYIIYYIIFDPFEGVWLAFLGSCYGINMLFGMIVRYIIM